MDAYFNSNLNKWWNGESTLERENQPTLYGQVTEADVLAAGYVKKEMPEPTVSEPTEQDKACTRMAEIEKELESMDYLTSKELDGEDMTEYGDYKAKRKALRAEYRTLESVANKQS